MGLNFRKLLISELERRQQEIDSLLYLLRFLQNRDSQTEELQWNSQIADYGASIRCSPYRNTESRHEVILGLREQGLSLRAIADQVCLSHAGVWKALQRLERNRVKDLHSIHEAIEIDRQSV